MELHIVTGAFGYSGKYIASRLLDAGKRVLTLTNSANRTNPFGGKIAALPFHFNDTEKMVASLAGASVLYNTYWVRFNHRNFSYQAAVENTVKLFRAAKESGIRRIVHISITNPSEMSELEYFRGKAYLERELQNTGLSYAILRPTVLFGKEDILINNIAWLLRRLPVFGVFGDGHYRLQPIYVDDLARLAIEAGRGEENIIIDATGPETFSYRELVQEIGTIIGCPRPIISVPADLGYLAGYLIGKMVGDTVITRAEIAGLMQELLYTTSVPAGSTKLTVWAREHADLLGQSYASELARRQDRQGTHENLDSQ